MLLTNACVCALCGFVCHPPDADPPELSVPSCSQQSSTLASIAYTSNEEGKLHCVVAANAAAVGQLSATDVQNNGVAAAVGSATVSFGFTGTSGTRVAVCGLADAEGNMASQVSCGPFVVGTSVGVHGAWSRVLCPLRMCVRVFAFLTRRCVLRCRATDPWHHIRVPAVAHPRARRGERQ